MLRRQFYDILLKWKENPKKKALLVTGARQIGKTSLIRQFGRERYRRFVELNFLETPRAAEIFRAGRDADTVLLGLTALLGVSLIPGETLIFFDEIQECPEARTAIKFLVEDGRCDYIESGSLLGVNSGEAVSYPVGFEEIRQMFPMDLEEFAWANGIGSEVIEALRYAFETGTAVTPAVHESMLRLFQGYVVTGGMPAVVQEFVSSRDMGRVVSLQRDILRLYRLDITKYARSGREKIRDIFDRIPAQLSDKNRRFMLSSIDKTARIRRYEESFVWLCDAGAALPCYNVNEPVPPLRFNEQRTLFKLFMGDTGLLCAAGLENVQFDILNGDLSVNMGGILENVFAQMLVRNGFPLWYFTRQKYGEVDFLLQKGRKCLPVEIKSGRDYRRHAALDHLLDAAAWGLDSACVFCRGNVEIAGRVRYLPWYMGMFLKQEERPSFRVDFSSVDRLRQIR
ncbi:AAA family ATPase [uncultured Mailhella sp.]|uniref:ATP-binding protein n=1 Tax=uncultured Mailhella sp. TaxID=1981031 RepID=UPI002618B248|nr:AAA family ATPase [uncultured Mailhella sp.]